MENKSVATAKVVREDGVVFSLVAKQDSIQDAYDDLAFVIEEHDLTAWVTDRNLVGDKAYAPPKSMVDEAESLGGQKVEVNFLGRKTYPVPAGQTKVGDAYEVTANLYSFDGDGIRFYYQDSEGKISKYPVAKQSFAGKGQEIFNQVFGGWEPELGSKIEMPTSVMYIECGPNTTSKGNPHHNIRAISKE